jgi:hypothetical protein
MGRPARDDLYERDFYAWTQDQARRLRAIEGDNRLDTARIAEEIEDLGRNDRRALAAHLMRALQHFAQAAMAVSDEPRAHWLAEASDHLVDARALVADSPSLVNRIDLERIWRTARKEANTKLRLYGDPELPRDLALPFTLEVLLDEALEPEDALARLRSALAAHSAES